MQGSYQTICLNSTSNTKHETSCSILESLQSENVFREHKSEICVAVVQPLCNKRADGVMASVLVDKWTDSPKIPDMKQDRLH